MTLRLLCLIALAAVTAACQHQAHSRAQSGQALAQASCSGCHAVERYLASPNPDAPPFAAVANQQGLTAATLASWLRDAHNYPEEMQFALDSAAVDRLVAYMLTLRDAGYRPAI